MNLKEILEKLGKDETLRLNNDDNFYSPLEIMTDEKWMDLLDKEATYDSNFVRLTTEDERCYCEPRILFSYGKLCPGCDQIVSIPDKDNTDVKEYCGCG